MPRSTIIVAILQEETCELGEFCSSSHDFNFFLDLEFFICCRKASCRDPLCLQVILTGGFFWNSSSRFFRCCGSYITYIFPRVTMLVSLVWERKSKYGVCFLLAFFIGLKECRYPCISASKKKNTRKT